MYCADCESIDEYFYDVTCFWIFVPTVETFGKVASICGEMGLTSKQENTHCISSSVDYVDIPKFLTCLQGSLEPQELSGTKVTTTDSYLSPDLEAIGKIATLEVLINRFSSKWLVNSVENEAYETWFQPIVKIAEDIGDPIVYANEGLFRIYDDNGDIVPPHLAFTLAEKSDLLFSLDLVARRSAVESAARGQLTSKLFINFNPSSIYDPAYCLRTTAASINEVGLRPEDVVFEITETHQASDVEHLKGILTFYRSAGFKVALDDIGSGWSGLNLMQSLRPDYVKIDMDLIRGVDHDSYKQNIVRNLINIAKQSGIEVIAEGVETEAEARWLVEAEADYLQGVLFGKPRPIAESVSLGDSQAISDSMLGLRNAAYEQFNVDS